MSRNIGAIARKPGMDTAVTAFEIELETFWVRLTRLAPGRVVEVWLTPRWALAMRYHPLSVEVGSYTREVSLRDFRDDCFFVLGQGGRRR